MRETELEILNMIRESEDPEKAMQIAIETLRDFVAERCPGTEETATATVVTYRSHKRDRRHLHHLQGSIRSALQRGQG